MRKLTALVAALGLLGTTSLTPVFAAPATDAGVAKIDLSAAKKKAKKSKAKAKKTSELSTDLSAAKKKAKKSKAKAKTSNVIVYRIAA